MKDRHGFTLIEVMVAASVLALGIILIYEAFFISLNAFNYSSHYLVAAPWLEEKMWEAYDAIRISGESARIETGGVVTKKGKDFKWGLSFGPIDASQGLYKIDAGLFWEEGPRAVRLSRSAYAVYVEREVLQ